MNHLVTQAAINECHFWEVRATLLNQPQSAFAHWWLVSSLQNNPRNRHSTAFFSSIFWNKYCKYPLLTILNWMAKFQQLLNRINNNHLSIQLLHFPQVLATGVTFTLPVTFSVNFAVKCIALNYYHCTVKIKIKICDSGMTLAICCYGKWRK